MTVFVIAFVVVALGALAVALARLIIWRENRRWEQDGERIAAHHERMAADNGRPYTDAVTRR